ncbi:Radial spoke head protein 3 like, partial [Pseudolycoriella hygida]
MSTSSNVPKSIEEPMESEATIHSTKSAFTVLNSAENLKTTYTKPNAIVRPSIRQNPLSGEDLILNNAEAQILLNDDGKSHYDLENFTKELDIKLRRLQHNKKGSSKNTEIDGANKEHEARRRLMLRKQHQRSHRGIIGTPPPVKGRRHETIQTDKYLEELLTRPIESDAQCQTDLFLHRPPTPLHIVSSIKLINAETQVLDGELFDFDAEVEPLLEIMIGRTVEQSLLEVLNEEEFADLRKQQQEFLTIREAEIADLRRLQSQEFTSNDDKKCQLHQDFSGREDFMEMQNNVTAAQLLQDHIAARLPSVLQAIDPFEENRKEDVKKREDIKKTLGPWLSKEVAEEVGRMIDSQDLLEELVREILEDRAAKYLKICEKEGKEQH